MNINEDKIINGFQKTEKFSKKTYNLLKQKLTIY